MFDIFSSHIFSRDSDLTSTNVSLSVRLSVTDQYVQGVPKKNWSLGCLPYMAFPVLCGHLEAFLIF